jgi:hypothetical protein
LRILVVQYLSTKAVAIIFGDCSQRLITFYEIANTEIDLSSYTAPGTGTAMARVWERYQLPLEIVYSSTHCGVYNNTRVWVSRWVW